MKIKLPIKLFLYLLDLIFCMIFFSIPRNGGLVYEILGYSRFLLLIYAVTLPALTGIITIFEAIFQLIKKKGKGCLYHILLGIAGIGLITTYPCYAYCSSTFIAVVLFDVIMILGLWIYWLVTWYKRIKDKDIG